MNDLFDIPRWLAFVKKVIKFGVVGLTATAVHAAVVIILVERHNLDPKVATALAFATAFLVSYVGSKQWVFVANKADRLLLLRFLSVALISFFLSLSGMYWVVDILNKDYLWGVFISCVLVPMVTFLMHNNWTFAYDRR